MAGSLKNIPIYGFFVLALALNVILWTQLRETKTKWLNVPPVPSSYEAQAFALGDTQLAYRSMGVMLQNIGDTGGNSTALKDYNYERLTQWFYLTDKLDPRSNFVPMLAGFYFGAVEDPEKLKPLAQYLHDVGSSTYGERWRWLAQAIYLQRYKINDMDTAYQWSLELAHMDKPDLPFWTKQMPAFIRNAEGDKQAAYDILVEIMKSRKTKIPAQEILVMKDYICKRILDAERAKTDPICQYDEPK